MKRYAVLSLAVILLPFLVVACGGEANKSDPGSGPITIDPGPQSSGESGPITIDTGPQSSGESGPITIDPGPQSSGVSSSPSVESPETLPGPQNVEAGVTGLVYPHVEAGGTSASYPLSDRPDIPDAILDPPKSPAVAIDLPGSWEEMSDAGKSFWLSQNFVAPVKDFVDLDPRVIGLTFTLDKNGKIISIDPCSPGPGCFMLGDRPDPPDAILDLAGSWTLAFRAGLADGNVRVFLQEGGVFGWVLAAIGVLMLIPFVWIGNKFAGG